MNCPQFQIRDICLRAAFASAFLFPTGCVAYYLIDYDSPMYWPSLLEKLTYFKVVVVLMLAIPHGWMMITGWAIINFLLISFTVFITTFMMFYIDTR